MKKNLTISLDLADWALVRSSSKTMGNTYSGLFHRLIRESLAGRAVNPKKVKKYKPLFEPEKEFMAQRAGFFAKAAFYPHPRP